MTTVPDLSNSVAHVVIRPGPPQPGPITIQTVTVDASGNLDITLSDGTQLPPVSFMSVVAQALQGTQLVAADANGSVLVRGVATIGRNEAGQLCVAEALPAGPAGLAAGSGILYRNADGSLGAA
jgi:hypothetical protein